MSGFEKFVEEDRRLAILRLLNKAPGRELNASVVQSALKGIGHTTSRDRVHADFDWLSEQRLIEVRTVGDSIRVAKLTQRGVDVATGNATVTGVKRPAPGA